MSYKHSNSIKILIIGYEHPFSDKRTIRSAISLLKIGKVYYQYLGNKTDAKKQSLQNVPLLPLNRGKKSRNFISWAKKWRLFDKKIEDFIRNYKPDLVYFHYMPFTGSKLFKIAKSVKAKIIFEIHEIIPEQFMHSSKTINMIRPLIWKEFRKAIDLSEGLIFVSEESAEYVRSRLKNFDEYFILPNYALKRIASRSLIKRSKEVVFVGKVGRNINMKVAKALINQGYTLKVIGPKRMPETLQKSQNIKLIPFLAYEQMMEEISKSMFSLLSFSTTNKKSYSNDIYSLPNKFFDSIAAGTPVIINEHFVSMKKYVGGDRIGVIIDSGNVEEAIEKIEKYVEDYDENLERLMSVQDKYVWDEKKEQEFINFILEVIR